MFLNKRCILLFAILLLVAARPACLAQPAKAAQLKKLNQAKTEKSYQTDTASVTLLNKLTDLYLYDNADSALYFAKQALALSLSQKNYIGEARSWGRIGRAYYVMGRYAASLGAANNLMGISTQMNYLPGTASAYQITGLVYLSQDNFPEAIATFNKALKLFEKLNDDLQAGKVYFDLGICYDDSGRPTEAIYYLEKARGKANKVKNIDLIAMTLNRTGEVYYHANNFQRALIYYTRVAAKAKTNNWELGFAYSGIARCFYKLNNYQQAVINAQKSYALATKVNSAFDAARAMQVLAESYAGMRDFKQAYNWQGRYKKANDSLFNSDKEKEINYLHLKQQQADNKQLQNAIKIKEQAIAFSKRLLLFRNMIATATIVFFVFVIINLRRKTALNKRLKKQNADIASQKEEISRQKEVLDELNRTKDQLFSVISHDLRGPFAAILQSIDAIRQGLLTANEQDKLMDDFHQQVTLVTNMVNNLLAWANSQQAGIKSNPLRLEVTALVSEIVSVSNFLAKNKGITINHLPNGKTWVFADADHVRIIIQNLLGNAIKFTPAGGTVQIYYSDDDGYLAIHVKDTGVGISAAKLGKLFKVVGKEISGYGTNNEGGAGIGLALIKQFTEACQGKLTVKSKAGEGSEFTVYFKKG